MRLYGKDINADTTSPLTLAFVGDAVFSLYIREMLVVDANRPVGKLQTLSVKWVKAEAQSKGMKAILPILNEKETEVFKRGRNAHTSHTPKNQSGCDYHYATGFEALVGYLYLKDEQERLKFLLNEVIKVIGTDEGGKA
ncbi:MAG: ribonuclease III [Clostridia bacterium]|nr:ribonuclease III [Clostridia bacterium]